MPLLALNADALERIVAWVLQLRADKCAGARLALRSEPFPDLLLCLDDVVFVALACKPLYEAMVSTLDRHRAAVASAYGVALPPPPDSPPPPRPEREGLSILEGPATWKRPRLVTSLEGVFVSSQRYVCATQGFADFYFYPDDRFPIASQRHSLWDRMHGNPCGRGSANLRFLEVACARDARDLARKEAFAGYRMSEAAVSAMLRVAPLTMVLGSFPEILSEHPRRCGLDLNERHHQLLVADAAFWGRTDVLERLVHSNPQACRAYDKQRGLLRTIREELQFPNAGADAPTDLQRWIVDPAVAGDRPEVLQWLTQVREDLDRQAYAAPWLAARQFRFTLPTHPDFMESAWLAARRGAVDALDWLFYTACAPIHEAGYGDYPFETTAAALGVLVLAFGGGRRGDTAGRQAGHRVAREGLQAVGASARWAQGTWQMHADNFYTDVAYNTSYDLLGEVDPLPATSAERETFLGFLALLNCAALGFEIEARAGTDATWTLGEWLLSKRALRHFARQALADVGDADHARWLIEESVPGGFLASVVPTPELDPDQCSRVEALLQGLSVPPALAMRTLRAELQRVFAEGRLGSIAQPPAFRERCTGRDALLQTALLMALQNQSGTHIFEGIHARMPGRNNYTVAVDRVDARGTIRSNAADALRHGAQQWGAYGTSPAGPFAFPGRPWLHCPALLGGGSLATKLGVHELRGVNSSDAGAGLLMAAYVESVLVGAEPRPEPLSVDTKCALVATGCFFPCPHPDRAAAAAADGDPTALAHTINRIGLHKNLRGPLRRLLAAVRARPGSRPEDAPLGDALRALCESEDLSAQVW